MAAEFHLPSVTVESVAHQYCSLFSHSIAAPCTAAYAPNHLEREERERENECERESERISASERKKRGEGERKGMGGTLKLLQKYRVQGES